MKEYPILFKSEMIRFIQSDRKTQTRRLIQLPQWSTGGWEDFDTDGEIAETICEKTGCMADILCPYGKVGDILNVRETWQENLSASGKYYLYAADYSESDRKAMKPWKSSIFMPRDACRLRLQIIDVCVERLQDISEEDAIAEGIQLLKYSDGLNKYTVSIENIAHNAPTAKETFSKLWAHIHNWESWASNPWLWIVKFKKL